MNGIEILNGRIDDGETDDNTGGQQEHQRLLTHSRKHSLTNASVHELQSGTINRRWDIEVDGFAFPLLLRICRVGKSYAHEYPRCGPVFIDSM
jgi:hypothetical protein